MIRLNLLKNRMHTIVANRITFAENKSFLSLSSFTISFNAFAMYTIAKSPLNTCQKKTNMIAIIKIFLTGSYIYTYICMYVCMYMK